MVEIERNPIAVRQGAAAVACIAAAAIAMPVISHRAAEQRDGAEWAARSTAFQTQLEQRLREGGVEPAARVELTAFRTPDGLRARGSAPLYTDGADTHAMLVQAALRGPLAPNGDAAPIERQIDARELRCMSEAIYFEARGESRTGQTAVAEVVMNRVRSRHYPNSICGVVYQGSKRATGCQFTFTCDGSLNRRPRGRAWEQAQHVATQVILGHTRPLTQRATHYHTHAVNPVWSAGLVETTSIGSHVFYRFPSRAEAPRYQQALMRRRAYGVGSREQANDDALAAELSQDLIPAAEDAALDAAAEVAAASGGSPAADPAEPNVTTTPATEAAADVTAAVAPGAAPMVAGRDLTTPS